MTPTQRHLDRLRRHALALGSANEAAADIRWAIARIERLELIVAFAGGALGDIEAVMDAASNARLTFDRLERQLKGVWEE